MPINPWKSNISMMGIVAVEILNYLGLTYLSWQRHLQCLPSFGYLVC